MDLLPLYQQCRRVRACRIKLVEQTPSGWVLHPAEPFLDPFPVAAGFINNQRPMPGGYCVVQDNGQMRYVHAQEFEDTYYAVDALKDRQEQLTRQLAEVNAAIEANSRRTTP